MPLQGMISRPAMAKVDKLAEAGHKGAKDLATYYVGQAVGLMKHEMRARDVVFEFKHDFADAVERLSGTIGVRVPSSPNSVSTAQRSARPTGHGQAGGLGCHECGDRT